MTRDNKSDIEKFDVVEFINAIREALQLDPLPRGQAATARCRRKRKNNGGT